MLSPPSFDEGGSFKWFAGRFAWYGGMIREAVSTPAAQREALLEGLGWLTVPQWIEGAQGL
jgi:hypothetical protein